MQLMTWLTLFSNGPIPQVAAAHPWDTKKIKYYPYIHAVCALTFYPQTKSTVKVNSLAFSVHYTLPKNQSKSISLQMGATKSQMCSLELVARLQLC